MVESLVLKSAHGGAEVRLQRPDATTIDVEINAAGLRARTGVYELDALISRTVLQRLGERLAGLAGCAGVEIP